MTAWSSFSSSPYLSAGDFGGREEKRLTIKDIRIEAVGRERDDKPVAYFQEAVKPLVLNKTNQRQLAVCGPTTRDCAGAVVVLHAIDTEFGGESMRGVRIKSVTPPRSADSFAPNARERAQQAPTPPRSVAAEMDDDIPFAPEWR